MGISVNRYRSIIQIRKSFTRRFVSSRKLIPILLVVMVILFSCIYIWQRVYVMDLAREVNTLKKEKSQLNDLLKKARNEVTDLSRRQRIEGIAIEKLGMTRTASQNMFTLIPTRPLNGPGDINDLLSSLARIADNLPVINSTKAEAMDFFNSDEK